MKSSQKNIMRFSLRRDGDVSCLTPPMGVRQRQSHAIQHAIQQEVHPASKPAPLPSTRRSRRARSSPRHQRHHIFPRTTQVHTRSMLGCVGFNQKPSDYNIMTTTNLKPSSRAHRTAKNAVKTNRQNRYTPPTVVPISETQPQVRESAEAREAALREAVHIVGALHAGVPFARAGILKVNGADGGSRFTGWTKFAPPWQEHSKETLEKHSAEVEAVAAALIFSLEWGEKMAALGEAESTSESFFTADTLALLQK